MILIGAVGHFLAYGVSSFQSPAAWGVFLGMLACALALAANAMLNPTDRKAAKTETADTPVQA